MNRYSIQFICTFALLPLSAPAATVVTSTFQGITHYERTETVPRQLVIHVVEIDLASSGVSFFTTPGNGADPGETTGQTTSQFVTQYGMQIGINSGFFSTAVAGTAYRNLSHIAVSDGVGVSPWSGGGNSRESAMNISQTNVATVIRPFNVNVADYNMRPVGTPLYTTVGGNERLLNNGTVVAADTALHPRTAIGVNGTTNKLYLLTVDGRQTGWSLGMSTVEVANLLKNDYGVTNAVNLDGGGSTTLVMQQPTVRTINRPSDGTQRVNGNNFGVRATPWPQWWVDAGGNWNTATNWTGGVPNAIGAVARLMGAITANRTVTVNVPVTVGTINLVSNKSYTVGGTNVVTLDVAAGSAAINVNSPSISHVIAAPTKLNDALSINTATAASLGLTSSMNNALGQAITKTGGGALTISGGQTHGAGAVLTTSGGVTNVNTNAGSASAANLTVNANATTNFNVTQQLAALNIGAGAVASLAANGARTLSTRGLTVHATGKLNLNDNDLLYVYTDPNAETAIRDLVKRGRDAGFGILSTMPAAGDTILAVADNMHWGRTSFNGITITPNAIVGKYTYFGDANLDGAVTSDDYVAVDVNLGQGNSWLEGDFNLSGTVTSDDYVAIDVNLGKGTPTPLAFAELKAEMIALHAEMFGPEYLEQIASAQAHGFAVVPEPGAMSILATSSIAVLLRRGRRRS